MPNAVDNIQKNGQAAVKLTSADGATCEIYCYGAHVASWKSADGVENLFVSSTAEIGGGKALRGGVPICWPQFAGKGDGPKHGFCRTSSEWKVVRTSTEPYPTVVFALSDSDATRAVWPSPFNLRYSVTLDGPQTLSTSLTVMNTGEEAFTCTGALHSYFACASAGAVQVHGLGGLEYENSAAGGATETQGEDELLAFAGETDRIYYKTPSELYLLNVGAAGRHMKVLKMGFPDAVAWNIGGAKAGTLKDLAPGEWERYVCLEAALIGKPLKLEPKCSYAAGQTFTAGAELPAPDKKKKKAAVNVS